MKIKYIDFRTSKESMTLEAFCDKYDLTLISTVNDYGYNARITCIGRRSHNFTYFRDAVLDLIEHISNKEIIIRKNNKRIKIIVPNLSY